MKKEPAVCIPLAEVRTTLAINAGTYSDNVFKWGGKIKLYDIGIGVVIQVAGKPDTLVYPNMLKTATALENISWKDGQHLLTPEEQKQVSKVKEVKKSTPPPAPPADRVSGFEQPAKSKPAKPKRAFKGKKY